MIGKNKTEKGFTLAEVLVTIFVFLLALTAIIGIFTSVLTAQRKINAERKLDQNTRFGFEELTRRIRSSKIDYVKQAVLPQPFLASEHLYLLSGSGESWHFFLNSQNLAFENNGAAPVNLFGDEIKVTNLKFYIFPQASPYFGGVDPNQSRVTVYLAAENRQGQSKAVTTLQTTITSRVYER